MEKKILKDLSMSNASFKKPIGSFKKKWEKNHWDKKSNYFSTQDGSG